MIIPTPYDGKWCHDNYSDAAKLIAKLHHQNDNYKEKWAESEKTLQDAHERISQLLEKLCKIGELLHGSEFGSWPEFSPE